MAENMIFPVAAREYGELSRSLAAAKEAKLAVGTRALTAGANEIGELLDELEKGIENLRKALKGKHEGILEAMAKLRVTVDALEKVVPDALWPLPKYREMLFVY